MDFKITRTVNGRPVSDEEMSKIDLMNDEMRFIVKQVLTDIQRRNNQVN